MLVTRFVTVLVCFIFLTSQAFAKNYRCELRPNGYAAAFTSLNPNLSRNVQQDFLESISPRAFKVNASYVTVENSRIEVSGGDREKTFHVRVNTNTYRLTYYININPFTDSGNVYIRPQSAYKNVGPIRYSCISTGGSSYKQSSVSSPFQQEFNNLTSCNKKYVQQFLKGQNLYNGAIDGLWGSGTAEGLRRAKNLSAFKNLTTAKMFEKLRLNPICN